MRPGESAGRARTIQPGCQRLRSIRCAAPVRLPPPPWHSSPPSLRNRPAGLRRRDGGYPRRRSPAGRAPSAAWRRPQCGPGPRRAGSGDRRGLTQGGRAGPRSLGRWPPVDQHAGSRAGLIWFGGGRTPIVTVYFRPSRSCGSGGRQGAGGVAEVGSLACRGLGRDGDRSRNAAEELRFRRIGGGQGRAVRDRDGAGGFGQRCWCHRAGKLKSETASIAVGGAGKAIVNAQRKLDATITGAGAVEYLGDPALTHRISGAGKISRRSAGGIAPAGIKTA